MQKIKQTSTGTDSLHRSQLYYEFKVQISTTYLPHNLEISRIFTS